MTGRIGRRIGGLVGLGQEAYQHNKEKKANQEAANNLSAPQTNSAAGSYGAPVPGDGYGYGAPPSYDSAVSQPHRGEKQAESSEDEDDEDLWIEDDAQTEVAPHQDPRTKYNHAGEWVDQFLQRYPPTQKPIIRLPAPVVIPQRRPGTRTRGFIRAYAPDLANSGIDQAAWLEFMDGFSDQTGGQNYFNVTNIAVALSVMSYTISCGPSIIVHLSALAVHTSIEAGRRLYISKQTNSYLDEMNARYFQPRGLYALVMLYDPDSKEDSQVMDFDTLSANTISKKSSDHQSTMSGFKGSAGKTIEQQIPEVCPLVFPDLEKASPEQQKNAFRRSVGFARDYYDRRERATFASHHEGSKLNMEEKEFGGKYGDPKTFQNSGLLGVVTGGHVDPGRRRRERKAAVRAEGGRPGMITGRKRRGPGFIGQARKGVRKVFQERVLYLMVVNMPSEEEMRVAAEMEARMKAEEPNWFEKLQKSVSR